MSQDNNNRGAPSSDDTSALFVTARKKQLEEQEAQRKAADEERKRLEAEAEVRRLEEAIRIRKQQAEEEARRLADPTYVPQQQPYGQQPYGQPQQPAPDYSAQPVPQPAAAGGAAPAKKPIDKRVFIFGGIGVAVIAIVVVLIVVLGGGSKGVDPASIELDMRYDMDEDAFLFWAPDSMDFYIDESTGAAYVYDEIHNVSVLAIDDRFAAEAENQMDSHGTLESLLISSMIDAYGFAVDADNLSTPTITETDEFTMGELETVISGAGLGDTLVMIRAYYYYQIDRAVMTIGAVSQKEEFDYARALFVAVSESLTVWGFGEEDDTTGFYDEDTTGYSDETTSADEYTIPEYLDMPQEGYSRAYEYMTGLTCIYPDSMSVQMDVGKIMIDGKDRGAAFIYDLTDLYNMIVLQSGAGTQAFFDTYYATCVAELQNLTGYFDVHSFNYQDNTGDRDIMRAGFDMMIGGEEWHGYAWTGFSKHDSTRVYGVLVSRRTNDDDSRVAFNEIITSSTIAPPSVG